MQVERKHKHTIELQLCYVLVCIVFLPTKLAPEIQHEDLIQATISQGRA